MSQIPDTIHVPVMTGDQVKYFGLLSEQQSLRTLRTDHSARCVWIWLGLAAFYFVKELAGNPDPQMIAFHRAIPYIAIAVGIAFVITDRLTFNHFRSVVKRGIEIGSRIGKGPDAFSEESTKAGFLGITIIGWKLVGGIFVWLYVLGNQYCALHEYLVGLFTSMKGFVF